MGLLDPKPSDEIRNERSECMDLKECIQIDELIQFLGTWRDPKEKRAKRVKAEDEAELERGRLEEGIVS
jgi:hypothetical protein